MSEPVTRSALLDHFCRAKIKKIINLYLPVRRQISEVLPPSEFTYLLPFTEFLNTNEEVYMKKILTTITTILLPFAISCPIAQANPIPRTDLNKVLNAGKNSYTSAPIHLQAGLYIVGAESSKAAKVAGTHYLLLDTYANDPNQFIGVLIDQGAINEGSPKSAFIFKSSSVRNGQTIMLYPLIIDMYGNLAVESELSRNSPYLELSAQATDSSHRYPYMIQGRNGLLNDHILGMRKSSEQLPNWKAWPSSGIYESGKSNSQIVVNGQTMTIHDNGQITQSYALTPINGDEGGKIAGLGESNFDTMSEVDITSSQFNKIAFFLQDFNQNNIFIVATPMTFPGRYTIKVYTPEKATFMDIFFPGLE
jgi:hypothetical protein